MIYVEFSRRLRRLNIAIDKALSLDNISGDLLPALFSVFSYLWCNSKLGK